MGSELSTELEEVGDGCGVFYNIGQDTKCDPGDSSLIFSRRYGDCMKALNGATGLKV